MWSRLSLFCFNASSTWLSRHFSVSVLELVSALYLASISSFSRLVDREQVLLALVPNSHIGDTENNHQYEEPYLASHHVGRQEVSAKNGP